MANLEELFDVTYTGPEIQAILDAAYDLLGNVYATRSWVNGQGYATQQWVNGMGYLTSADLSGYAQQQWVLNQGYASQAWVNQQGFATQSWVQAYAYIDTENGVIYLGENSITPITSSYVAFGTESSDSIPIRIGNTTKSVLTQHQSLAGYQPLLTIEFGGTSSNFSNIIAPYSYSGGGYVTLDFLPLAGGALTGDLRLKPSGSNYGSSLLFGNGTYCYLKENIDDHLTIYAEKGVDINSGTGYNVQINGSAPATQSWVQENYLPLTGGQITGDLRLKPSSANYGSYLYFGDGSYCYLNEDTDDHIIFHSRKGIDITTDVQSGATKYPVNINGVEIMTLAGGTLTGSLTIGSENSHKDLEIHGATHLDGTLSVENSATITGLLTAEDVISTDMFLTTDGFTIINGTYKGSGTCTTNGTSKTSTISGYTLNNKNIVVITFTKSVQAGSTMNIGFTGDKPIYYMGASIVNNIINAGETWTLYYDGTNYNAIRASKTYSSGATVRVAYDGRSYWTETSVMAKLSVKNAIYTDKIYIGVLGSIYESDGRVTVGGGNGLLAIGDIETYGILTADSVDVASVGKYFFGDAYIRFDSSDEHLYFYKGSGSEIMIA